MYIAGYCLQFSFKHALRIAITEAAQTTNFSGTSILRSPMGLGKSDFNGEVTDLELTKVGRNGEVTLLVR